jgi:hypothetical protein
MEYTIRPKKHYKHVLSINYKNSLYTPFIELMETSMKFNA